jgi:preprotein translocase subunit SecB
MEQPEQPQSNFVIQKIYTKDISFESPSSPEAFKLNWSPQANVELNMNNKKLDNDIYEIDLIVTVTTKNQNESTFVIEVNQSGIFTISNIPEDQMGHMLGSFCPSILFPYAKETINGLVNKGGYPQINLTPINFDALYMQNLAQHQTSDTKH